MRHVALHQNKSSYRRSSATNAATFGARSPLVFGVFGARSSLLLATFVLTTLLAISGCSSEPPPLAGYTRQPTPEVGELSLPAVESDGADQPFQFQAAEDGLLLVYFGYTSCPDACPTTLSDVRAAIQSLDVTDQERVEVAMVTIDPDVDHADTLVGYVRSFVDGAHAIRTEDESQLRSVAGVFGADFDKVDDEVIHTGALYGVDSQGRLIITWPFGIAGPDLESDVHQLLSQLADA